MIPAHVIGCRRSAGAKWTLIKFTPGLWCWTSAPTSSRNYWSRFRCGGASSPGTYNRYIPQFIVVLRATNYPDPIVWASLVENNIPLDFDDEIDADENSGMVDSSNSDRKLNSVDQSDFRFPVNLVIWKMSRWRFRLALSPYGRPKSILFYAKTNSDFINTTRINW